MTEKRQEPTQGVCLKEVSVLVRWLYESHIVECPLKPLSLIIIHYHFEVVNATLP